MHTCMQNLLNLVLAARFYCVFLLVSLHVQRTIQLIQIAIMNIYKKIATHTSTKRKCTNSNRKKSCVKIHKYKFEIDVCKSFIQN
jgi:hypothetical protein